MGMHEGRANLSKIVRDLQSRWDELRVVWDDANSHAFEERFIHPLVQDARSAGGAMDHMSRILTEIKRDCG